MSGGLNSRLESRYSGELSIDLTLNRAGTMRVMQNGSGRGSHEPIERANSVTLEARLNLDGVFGRDA